MDKVYKTSRTILWSIAAIAGLIVFLPAGAGCLIAALIAGAAGFLLGFPCTKLTQKVIALGDRIRNRLLNALYFVGLPVIAALLCYLAVGLTGMASDQIPTDSISDGITAGTILAIPLALIFTTAVLVTLQTWIVVILRLFMTEPMEPDTKRSNEQ